MTIKNETSCLHPEKETRSLGLGQYRKQGIAERGSRLARAILGHQSRQFLVHGHFASVAALQRAMVEDAFYLSRGLLEGDVESATSAVQRPENHFVTRHIRSLFAQFFELLFISEQKISLFFFS